MKIKQQVINENPELKGLINAVISRIGIDSVNDVVNHGIDSGFNGFTYTADTVNFFNRHKKTILKMAENLADDIGEDMLSMIASFNCLKDSKPTLNEIGQAIYSGQGKNAYDIENAMAWFAAEEVCRLFED